MRRLCPSIKDWKLLRSPPDASDGAAWSVYRSSSTLDAGAAGTAANSSAVTAASGPPDVRSSVTALPPDPRRTTAAGDARPGRGAVEHLWNGTGTRRLAAGSCPILLVPDSHHHRGHGALPPLLRPLRGRVGAARHLAARDGATGAAAEQLMVRRRPAGAAPAAAAL